MTYCKNIIKFTRTLQELSGHCINNQQLSVASVFGSLNPHPDISSIQIKICPDKQHFSLKNVLCPAVISHSTLLDFEQLFHSSCNIVNGKWSGWVRGGRSGWAAGNELYPPLGHRRQFGSTGTAVHLYGLRGSGKSRLCRLGHLYIYSIAMCVFGISK